MALPFLPWLGPFGLLCSDVVWCRPFPFIIFFATFQSQLFANCTFQLGPIRMGLFSVCAQDGQRPVLMPPLVLYVGLLPGGECVYSCASHSLK